MKGVFYLLKKDFTLEWRNKYALNGILLYLIGSIYISYMSFQVKKGSMAPNIWNALFWIIILFSAMNAIGKSFFEKDNREMYYYSLVRPSTLIVSKIIYNCVLVFFISMVGFLFYIVIMGNPVADISLYVFCILLSSLGLPATLTLVSSISSKSSNGSLMAILGFPLVLPILLIIIKISNHAIDGLDRSTIYDELTLLTALIGIVITASLILFPYLWKK